MQENDPGTHFAPLFALLETIVAARDYTNPTVAERTAACTQAARNAGVPPERILAYLRQRLHDAPLSAVGDWYRGVLVDRIIARAIDSYFDNPPGAGSRA